MLKVAKEGHHHRRLCDPTALLLPMRNPYVRWGGRFSPAFTRSDYPSQVKELVREKNSMPLIIEGGVAARKVRRFLARMTSVQNPAVLLIILSLESPG